LTKEKYIIGVDLGGTWVRLALSDKEGNFIGKVQKGVDDRTPKLEGRSTYQTNKFAI